MWSCVVSLLLFTVGTALPAAAATIRVPSQQPTIQQAIVAAGAGDTILVAPGTYVENLDFLGKAITVTSEAGAEATVIDGNRMGSVVRFTSGETRAAVLDGFTVRNGQVDFDGGGILIDSASPTIRNNMIVDNVGCAGVGIAIRAGGPLIQGNAIARNAQQGCSGGTGGGGIGAIIASGLEILDNVIADNTIGASGGGISLFGGTAIVRGNQMTGNTGSGGGGIAMYNGALADIVQNVIAGNQGNSNGGGVAWSTGVGERGPWLVNNTIAGNTGFVGPAIFAQGAGDDTRLVNNIVVGPAGQAAIDCDNLAGDRLVLQANDVFTPGGPAYGVDCVDRTGQNGNISADPLFLDATAGDYRLSVGSPAIDAGDGTVPGLPDTDFEGDARILDGDGDGTAVVDMGADELSPDRPPVSVFPASHHFGDVELGAAAERTFTVRNLGATPVEVTVSTAGPFGLVSAPIITLGPAAMQEVTVRFTPTAAGFVAGTVTFAFDDTSISGAVSGVGFQLQLFTLLVARPASSEVTVVSAPSGIDCGGDCVERYAEGTVVRLVAHVELPAVFGGWTGCDTVFEITCTVTMNANRTVTARGGPLTLAVGKTGTGGGVVVSAPAGIDCGPTCLARFGEAAGVTLTAVPAPGSAFLGWGPVCPGTGPCALTMDRPRLVMATFARLPDLALTSLSAPATAQTSRPLVVTALVRNLGQVAAKAFRITYFLSAADPAPGAGVAVGFRDVGGLGPGVNLGVVTALTVPVDLAAGDYFLSAVIDAAGVVAELDETNNRLTAAAPVTVSLFRPDLTLAALSVPATGQTGKSLVFNALVRNVGPAPATAFRLAFFMSPSDPTPGAGVLVGFRDVGGLAARTNASFVASVTVPLAFEAGDYYVSAIVDSRLVVTELGEGDNGLTAPTRVAISLLRSDLTVSALVVPALAQTGRSFTARATMRNLGQVPARAFRLAFFMSPSDATPGAGTLVGFRDVGGLAPGVNASVVIALTVPIGFEPGAYYLSAVADSGGVVIELDETNNGRTAGTLVEVALLRSDLTLAILTAPLTGQTGRPLTVNARVRNIGAVAAGAFRIAFFMSADDPTPGAGTLIGFRDVGRLAPGLNASLVTTLTVPLALDAGDYYLSAVVDSGGAVTELDEANNGLTAATQVTIGLVRADLTVAILTAPATAQTGRPLRVNLRTRNLGQAPAPAFRVTFFMAAGDPTPGAGVPLGVRNFGSLAAGANASVTATITVPAALVPGDYYLSALADTGGTVIELDEANNGRTAPALVTVALYRPDLRLTALTGPAAGVVVNGRSMIVSSTARNLGPAPAGAFRIAFYLSADTILDTGDILLGTRRVGSLAADAVSTATSTLAIPPLTPPFDYYLIAAVDDLQIVAELGEDDNVLATATTFAVLPNLARDTTTNLTLTFSHCTDPDLNTSGSGPVRFRVPVHTTAAFTASSGFTESAQGITLVTTFTFAGTVDVRGVVTGTYIMRTTVPGFGVVFSSTGSLAGEVFGPQLSGSFAGVLNVFTGDDCQLTAGFSGS